MFFLNLLSNYVTHSGCFLAENQPHGANPQKCGGNSEENSNKWDGSQNGIYQYTDDQRPVDIRLHRRKFGKYPFAYKVSHNHFTDVRDGEAEECGNCCQTGQPQRSDSSTESANSKETDDYA